VDSVIITGASGFIGRHCIAHLLDAGYVVHAFYHKQNPSRLPRRDRLTWHCLDLLDHQQTLAAVQPLAATHLLHLAWVTDSGKFRDSRLNLEWLRSSVHLLKVFIESGGGRFVGVGSVAEYDWSGGTLSEASTPLNPASLYGSCKSSLFQTARQNTTMSGIEFAWGRIFWLYGPGEDKRRIVPCLMNALLADEEADCSEGAVVRDYLYVDDAARALVTLLGSNVQGAVNIASGVGVKIRTLVETIAKLIDKERLVQYGAVPEEDKEHALVVADVSRLRNELNFEPQYNLDDGLLRTLEWWRCRRNLRTGEFTL
jgi:nucleoside-diphosphate-sugar epimerase